MMIPFLRKGHGGVLLIIIGGLLLRLTILALKYNSLELDASFVIHGEVAHNVLAGKGIVVNEEHVASVLQRWRTEHRLIDFEEFPPTDTGEFKPLYMDEPGYGLLLAALWKLFGSQRWVYVRIVQILIDVLMVGLVYSIGRKVWNENVASVAGVLYALFLPHIELVVRPHRDCWVTFAYIVSVYLLLRLRSSEQTRKQIVLVILLGTIAAATAWMRSTIVMYVAVCAVVLFLIKPARIASALAVILVIAFSLVLSPLIVRNYQTFDKLMITRGALWHSFWAGVGQFPNSYGMIENDEYVAKYFRKRDSTAEYGTDRYEQVLRSEGLKFIAEQPLWYASTVVRRAAVILSPKIGREVFFQQTSKPADTGMVNRGLNPIVLLVIDGMFVTGLFFGLWLSRSRRIALLVVTLPLLYTIVTLSPIYVVGRNIMNVYFVTLILTSVSVVWVGQHWRGAKTAGTAVI